MDKTKHGLRKYHFWLVKVRVYGGRREEKRREEEKRRRQEEEEEEEKRRRRNQGMECLKLLYGILGWNCLERV